MKQNLKDVNNRFVHALTRLGYPRFKFLYFLKGARPVKCTGYIRSLCKVNNNVCLNISHLHLGRRRILKLTMPLGAVRFFPNAFYHEHIFNDPVLQDFFANHFVTTTIKNVESTSINKFSMILD
jgi:hypothetical protein